jgi:hypothetical protein
MFTDVSEEHAASSFRIEDLDNYLKKEATHSYPSSATTAILQDVFSQYTVSSFLRS